MLKKKLFPFHVYNTNNNVYNTNKKRNLLKNND